MSGEHGHSLVTPALEGRDGIPQSELTSRATYHMGELGASMREPVSVNKMEDQSGVLTST